MADSKEAGGKGAVAVDATAVLEAVRAHEGGIKASVLADVLGVPHTPLRERLREWEAAGMLRRSGNTKATLWHLASAEGADATAERAGTAKGGRRRLVRPDPARAKAAEAAPVAAKGERGRKPKTPKKGATAGTTRRSAPRAAAKPAAARSTGRARKAAKEAGGVLVWRVRTEGDQTAYVLGTSLADAARVAREALGQDVVAMDLLGPVVTAS